MAFLNGFNAMITSVVCFVTFVTRHCEICTNNLRKFDVHCGKLLRLVVGPPARIDWNQPWHTLLHEWHKCIDQQLKYLGFKIWSAKYLSESSTLATTRKLQLTLLYFLQVAGKYILDWQSRGGRPGASFSHWHDIGHNTDLWIQRCHFFFFRDDLMMRFSIFSCLIFSYLTPIAWKGCGLECPKWKM